MCQLCGINDIAASARFPKPVATLLPDIKFLIKSSHDEYESHKRLPEPKIPPSESFLDVLRLLNAALEQLETERVTWWTSPKKRDLRKRLDLECDQKKLTELHKINNTAVERIEAMTAKLGTFVK